jgi:hypothetical protein
MPRAKFYDDMGVGRRLPLAGGCYASARPAVDGGVVITVRDAKGRVLYGGDEIRPRGRFGDDVPFSISAEALRQDAERRAGDWKQREQLHQNYRGSDRCRDDDDRRHRFHGGRREDDRGRGELRRFRADEDPREEGSPRRYTPEEMPAALRDFQRQLDEHYGRRPRAADARRRLRARLRDQGWSDDAIDALEDYFHEWSASHRHDHGRSGGRGGSGSIRSPADEANC